jgi:hypothetical protein
MLRREKEETPRSLFAGSLLTRLLRRARGYRGVRGYGSRLHSINNLIKPALAHGSRRSTANAAMLTCGDFRNGTCGSIFDKVACVAAGRARNTKAREGAPENTRFHLERFTLRRPDSHHPPADWTALPLPQPCHAPLADSRRSE